MKKLKKPCIRKIEVYVRLYGGGATNEGCNCCSWQYKKGETYIMKKLIKPMKKMKEKLDFMLLMKAVIVVVGST